MSEAKRTHGESIQEVLVHAGLFSHALEVPHKCDDPRCPGNANRLKLAAFDELLEALKDLLYVPHVIANAPGSTITEIRQDAEAKAKAAIAQAEANP